MKRPRKSVFVLSSLVILGLSGCATHKTTISTNTKAPGALTSYEQAVKPLVQQYETVISNQTQLDSQRKKKSISYSNFFDSMKTNEAQLKNIQSEVQNLNGQSTNNVLLYSSVSSAVNALDVINQNKGKTFSATDVSQIQSDFSDSQTNLQSFLSKVKLGLEASVTPISVDSSLFTLPPKQKPQPKTQTTQTQKPTSTAPVDNPAQDINYALSVIASKGFTPKQNGPSGSIQDAYGKTLYAYDAYIDGGDGTNQWVFFFVNGTYIGTDTAQPHGPVISVYATGTGSIAVQYAVYNAGDIMANPTGTPFTIIYHWDGSRLLPDAPMQSQFLGN